MVDEALSVAGWLVYVPIDIEFTLKGNVGTASPVQGVITSFQEQIEWHLRVGFLRVGLAVGVLYVIGMRRKLRRK